MSPLLHVLLVGALAQGDVDRLLGEERFREALVASESLEGVERSRQRTLVLWSAGDLGGALQEARAGLTEGEDLLLQLALELRDTEMAWRELDALETHRQSLGPDDPWAVFLDEQIPDLRAAGTEVVLHGSARVIARSLATWIVGLSGFLALLIFGWSSLPSRRPGT